MCIGGTMEQENLISINNLTRHLMNVLFYFIIKLY